MNRIQKAFENKKAFIAFLTAGDPIKEKTIEYIFELEKAGASLIEIGIPFSDPIAEGPVIQDANIRALKHHMTTDGVFEIVKAVREKSDIPLCLMTYLNPVFHYGYDRFFKNCQEVGVDGIIIPDCPYEESGEVKEVAKNYGVKVISMIAPTSKERIKMIAQEAEGFIYLVSSLGVTGVRDEIQTDLSTIIKDIKEVTDVPVAIGFGIHSPEQVQQMNQYADGTIVGSAIVKIIGEHGENAHQALYDYVKDMTQFN
ncbi:MAG: tryptophan synthase subunit alpha [Erysipelotrichaceae bacterium]|nr:tryptophan synthase subunit alpha [Erysipelotrichaceae bacterium]